MAFVKQIELFEVEIPVPKPFALSWERGHLLHSYKTQIIRLTSDSGLQGVSSGCSRGVSSKEFGAWLERSLLGVNIDDISTVRKRLQTSSRNGWRHDWIEAAFWDLLGKQEQKPLYQIWSPKIGTVDEIPVYCSTLECLGTEQRRESLQEIVGAGFRAIKLRLSGDFAQDVLTVGAVREEVGEKMSIMLDAEQGNRSDFTSDAPKWKLTQAMDFVTHVAPFRIEWLEEPLDMYDYDDLSVLSSESEIPIAGGESNAGWHEFKLFFEKRSLDIYQLNPLKAGGIETALQVMDACLRRDLHYTPDTGMDSISFLINAQLYATWPKKFFLAFPFEPGKWTPETWDVLLKEPIELKSNGSVKVSQNPGFGFELDEEKLQKYAKRLHLIEKE